ncbi:MAG TPA: hypothetical protein VMR46_00265 [Candidatus Paceibacterota bacterium]|nr:hypothetical protein [Candidatus Paceibacterota bacterium]
MATIINNPPSETTIAPDSSSGWAVAVIILLVVIAVGAFAWIRYHRAGVTPAPSTTVQVNLPSVGSNSGTSPATQ